MEVNQAMEILQRIAAAYTKFDLTGDVGKKRIELWIDHLSKLPYEPVLAKVDEHILNNRFPPSIAEIKVRQPEKNEFLAKQKEWERNAKYSPKR
ncbi:replicative helicase loader/inhibitor [Bacillus haynesii]|uniref:replicative helicase loader/inhibitor n=1 Tax=Bacillus haynesii TaxID=1925021 RepID=UPI002DB797C8|nr:replicative helicase loader/inhibitor [Bacillus haynesii]MEC1551557.1 replicative helicase loader/inhibitor [Bacillus haynesii]